MTPYLPFSSERLHNMLRYEGQAAEMMWEVPQLIANHQMAPPERLFKKLDASLIDEEQARIEQF